MTQHALVDAGSGLSTPKADTAMMQPAAAARRSRCQIWLQAFGLRRDERLELEEEWPRLSVLLDGLPCAATIIIIIIRLVRAITWRPPTWLAIVTRQQVVVGGTLDT